MTPEEKFNQEIWWILQEIKKEYLITLKEEKVEFFLRKPFDSPFSFEIQKKLLRKLKEQKVLDFLYGSDVCSPPMAYSLTICQPKFDKLYNFYKKNNTLPNKKIQSYKETSKFVVSVKDREIWVNNYLIGKPHAVGSNLEFFDYIRSQNRNTKIERNKLPSKFGDLSIQKQVKNKSFIKILNGLGFKGEILKAFFYKRGKDTLTYRGNEITKTNLEEAGVKTSLFLKELELAHIKNSPE